MIQSILCLLGESTEAYPHKTVFADEHTSLTYRRLLDLSMRIGGALGQKTDPRRPVPVLAEKSTFTLAAFMGTVWAGCSYISLDAGQPIERLNRILDTLQADLMTADKESLSLADPVSFLGEILPLEDLVLLLDGALSPGLPASIRRQSADMDPLYGISTSGSAGVPKDVVANHCSVIDFIGHFTGLFHITQDDIIDDQVPPGFDISVKDIYSTLKTGATLEVIPKKLFSTPTGPLDYLCDRKIITAIQAVSTLCIITTLKGFTYRVSSHLNKILFNGEVMSAEHLNTWCSCLPRALFVNLHGPTEIIYSCTYYVVDRKFESGMPVPIGRSFPNETIFSLDENNRLITESGQNGELCVAGTALVLGYYGDPRHAAMAFVQNPLGSCYLETVYRAGDPACYGRDGSLYFNGRGDFQIKHMGHRVEFDETEAALETAGDADRAVRLFLGEKNRIMAFYKGTAVKRGIATDLESPLPHYMFPSLCRNLMELPHTENGRVDRQVLRRLYR